LACSRGNLLRAGVVEARAAVRNALINIVTIFLG
jgi:Na+-transporting methylmalonyl-CoA/oxaloacetate decarboxylase beta subunit